jgi:hypothetical protein
VKIFLSYRKKYTLIKIDTIDTINNIIESIPHRYVYELVCTKFCMPNYIGFFVITTKLATTENFCMATIIIKPSARGYNWATLFLGGV